MQFCLRSFRKQLAFTSATLLVSVNSHAGPITSFQTVVNNNDLVPGSAKNFNSYNQPSVNTHGLVAFRARSQGGQPGGQPESGVFTRNMSSVGNPVTPIAMRGDLVPAPNNTDAIFNEFPSIPRIDARSSMIATRGQSRPVLEYQVGVDPNTGEPETTKGGTSGIYTNPTPPGGLRTGMSGLGNVTNTLYPANPDLSYFQVPNTTPGTKFDQFPGAPSPTGGDTVVFKGNWTDSNTGIGMTGVYYRDVLAEGGTSPVRLIADSNTDIPGFPGTKFGSTAPPSAANGHMVFLGVDNEAAPTKGGIYMAALDHSSAPGPLDSIISIGQDVMGRTNAYFTQLGESLSFDGRHVGFWGAWGSKDQEGNLVAPTRDITVSCASIENAKTSSFCLEQDNGSTAGSSTPGDGLYTFEVPVNQGFFIADVTSLETRLIAETGNEFLDFVYWNFSGKVPGAEDEEDGEVARWRSASFIAIDGWNAAFKGTPNEGDAGLFLMFANELSTVAQLGDAGTLLDPQAVDADGIALPIVSIGIERDGFRNGWLAINGSMTDGETSMAGVYLARTVPIPGTELLFGLGGLILFFNRRNA